MATADSKTSSAVASGGYKDRFWIPRFWDGITISGWFGILWRNRFAVTPRRIAMSLIIVGLSLFNFVLWLLQTIFYGRTIAKTVLKDDPLFVVGHWRSGTTMLHEMLVLDDRHGFADTFACFAPNHFLFSAWFLKPLVRILLPSKRPMDNMAAGWDHPQEDEFALCNMGVRSPYLTAVFPNLPPQDQEYFDLQNAPAEGVRFWKDRFLWFLRCLTVKNPKRIVLKSPPHTCRIKTLLEMFPNAKFVHIVRDPYVLFPSTMNLWKRLYRDQGLQVPHFEGLEEYVFGTLERMYDVFQRDRTLMKPGQFSEVRYEELVRNPLGEMERVYRELELGGFEKMRPILENYAAGQKDYKKNRYEISPEIKAEIARRWKDYIDRYDYAGNG